MKQYFIAICIVLLAVSCSDDSGKGSPPAPPTPSSDATLTLMIPGFRSASDTRAGVSEAAINEIDVLLFRNVSGTERVVAMFQVPAASLHDTGVSGETRFSVGLPAGDYSRLALVVNAHSELTAAGITATSPGSSYADLQSVQTSGRNGSLGSGSDKSIPMYGEYAPSGGFKIEAGVPKTFPGVISIIRSMARVDFVNQETSGDFVPSNVYFNNVVGNGTVYVDPKTYGIAADAGSGGSNYLSPTLPTPLTAAAGSQSDPGSLSIDWSTPPPPSYTYYLYEQPVSGASALNYSGITRPRMVLKAKYKGKDTWYPIDFTWDGNKGVGAAPYTKGSPMPILRNHRYVFTIKEVKGPGYPTWGDAFTASGMLTNQTITIQTHVIDEAYTDVVFNSTGFLAVSRTAMALHGKKTAASTDNKVEVLTNVTGGFRVQSFNANGTEVSAGGWLQPSQVAGSANAKTTVQAITDGKGFKDGYLEVRAGRLYTKVNVGQLGVPLDYVAEYNLAGGSEYGTKPNNASLVTSAQTDGSLRWATSHNNDQSGYYNWYVLKGIPVATYNPGPNHKNLFGDDFFKEGHPGHGYHLPSRWELTGVFSYNTVYYNSPHNVSNVNEAVEFGGIKKTFANDYYSMNSGFCYALRFKQATGNPNDGSSLTDFPKATDNSMLCAYRYTRVGSFANDNNLTSQLKVDCVYLGSSFTGDINTINNESWWNVRTAETTTRIFPVAGQNSSAPVSGSGTLDNRGYSGCYWSGTEDAGSYAWFANFVLYGALVNGFNDKSDGFPVRLFASK